MNKNAIKRYAIWARNELIERVSHRAAVYGITDADHGNPNADSVNGKVLTATEKSQRQALIRKVNEQGYQIVMEEVAFTWFNRFAALRFMEVNGYLPSHVRVFTNDDGQFKPQMLTEAIHLELDGLDKGKVFALEKANQREDLFKYLLITQCNALSAILPGLFQKIDDYTELLLPDFLLREGSVIQQMVELIPEEDWTDQVQIIGWLYQYYNTEPKDKVFGRKSGEKIKKEEIPAATQLFTPDWIVRYMVENSLGRLYVEREMANVKCETEEERPAEQKQIADRMGWQYYLPEAPQEPEVREKLNELGKKSFHSPLPTSHSLKPEDIRVIDPCMGSGHILCYLFDVLVQIYEAYGYSVREAVRLIVEKNLYGLDLDERAGQLAYFAVMMKARQYDRRFFSRDVQPNIGHFQGFTPYRAEDFSDPALQSLVKAFENADEYGSLLEIKDLDIEAAANAVDAFTDDFLVGLDAREKLLRMVQLVRMLSQKYDVVVTNPPYMGGSGMDDRLSNFLKKRYPDSKSDLFAVFIERGNEMTQTNGYNCMVTMQSWMFLSSYEKMRQNLLNQRQIVCLMHMENMVMHIAFGTAVTVFRNNHLKGYKGTYNQIKMRDISSDDDEKPICFPIKENRFAQISTDNFAKIPGAPVAYWVSDKAFNAFNAPVFGQRFFSGGRNKTHNNNLYVRNWWEIIDTGRWKKYSNGGDYRKWYGNDYDVVDWSDKARAFYASHGGLLKEEYWNCEAITWNDITSGPSSYRIKLYESAFSSVSPTIFNSDLSYDYTMLGFLNSTVCRWINEITNPTLHTLVGNILLLPDKLLSDTIDTSLINNLVEQNIALSRADWDSFETSWDFKKHPLI